MKRLLDESLAPELEEILRSAEEDAPRAPERREDRIIAAIAAASTVGTAATAAATTSRLDSVVRIAKWGVPLVGVIAAATFAVVSAAPEPAASRSDAATSTSTSTDERIEASQQATETPAMRTPAEWLDAPLAAPALGPAADQAVRVEDLPTATPATQPPSPRVDGDGTRGATKPATAPITAAAPNIDAEIAAIDKARAALTGDRPAEALSRVETYRSTFSGAHFADEADAIEIQALAALGRKEEARRKAEVFLERRARSPYAQRVRSAAGLK